MCTRFRTVADLERLLEEYGITSRVNYEYNPNVAPTETVPIIRTSKSEGKKITLARFGLVPPWSKTAKPIPPMVNARADTIAKKPAFKQGFEERRCIIPVEGFYEWTGDKGDKKPWFIHHKEHKILSLAGIWDYAEIENEKIFSFAISTTDPNSVTEALHDRTPVIIEDKDGWLKKGGREFLHRPPEHLLDIRPVNPAVNKVTVKDIDLIEPAVA